MNIVHQLREQKPDTIIRYLQRLNQTPGVYSARLGDRLPGSIFSNIVIYVHESGVILVLYDLPDGSEGSASATAVRPIGFRLSPVEKILQVSGLLLRYLSTSSFPVKKIENVVLTPCILANYDEMQEVWKWRAAVFHQMPDDKLHTTLGQDLKDDDSLPGWQLVNTFCSLVRSMLF